MNNLTPDNGPYWIQALQLQPHIEGGAFREAYRSDLVLPRPALTPLHLGDRNAMTCIYFLLLSGEFSAFHRIASDEVWHYYTGGRLTIYEIDKGGSLHILRLGLNVQKGESPMVVIRAGSWFGSRVEEPHCFTLCGCTVAPGFDFADFELADRNALLQQFPEHSDIIIALTRV